MKRLAAIVLGLGLLALVAVGIRPETPVPGWVGADCRIHMTETLQIDDTIHGPSIATAWVDSDGRRLFMVDVFDRQRIAVFDAGTGEFLERVGNPGQGPGEFMAIAGIRVVSDSLLVVDQQNQRLTVLDPDLRPARESPLPIWPMGALQPLSWVPDLGLVMNGWVSTSEAPGTPLHRLGPAGQQELSFGSDPDAGAASPLNGGMIRLVTPRPSRVFWSLRADHYLLEQWDLETGSRLGAVLAEDDWVSHAWRDHEQTVQDPPILLSLLEDDGLLWVVGAEPSEPDAEGPVRHGEAGAPGRDRGEIMDLRLEVLDPASGSAIARVTLPHYAGFFMSTGELVTFRSIEPPGRMQIWSFELGCDSPAPTPGPP